MEETIEGALVVVVNNGVPRWGLGAGAGVIWKPESVGAVLAIFRDSWNKENNTVSHSFDVLWHQNI